MLLCAACTSQEKPERGAVSIERTTYPPRVSRAERTPVDPPTPTNVVATLEPETEEPKEEAERDLEEELRRAIGAPVDCVRDFESETATRIRIPVTATVRPTGMVIQPVAAGVGLSADARRCVEERAALVKLEPLEKPLSKTISTVIEIDYVPPVVVEIDPSGEPALRNVREPLPKRAEVQPSGRPIREAASRPIQAPTSRDPTGPSGRPVIGPKPRPVDGYDVDENAQQWR